MGMSLSRFVLLAAEATFAVLFVRALFGYLRRRDPLEHDVTLVFTPCAVLFCNDIARQLNGGTLPTLLSAIGVTLLLAQPYLTVRLAGRLHSVPRWLDRTVLVAFVAVAVPVFLAGRPLPPG